MGKLPETVKIARVPIFQTAAGSSAERFNIPLGQDEVMVLLAMQYWFTGVLVAGGNGVELTLYKKTDEDPPANGWDASPDIIHHVRHRIDFVTESIKACDRDYMVFPRPLILIRAPRLNWRTSIITYVTGDMRLYYQLRDVSDVELAKLMVKDHA